MTPHDYQQRNPPCKTKSLLTSVFATLMLILVVTALLLSVAGPIGSALDRQDAAESEMVQKLRKAREALKAEGKKVEGRSAYGETAEERRIIKRIKMMRRKRRGGHKGLTYQAIADNLNAEGIPTKDGKKWSKGQVHKIANR